MAAGWTPERGTPYAPCESVCEHTDCAATREDVARPCRICNQAIGYGARIYAEPDGSRPCYVHAACVEDQIDQERAAKQVRP